MERGPPWHDPRRSSVYGYGGVGSALQIPNLQGRSDNMISAVSSGGGGVLKRNLSEMERWQQQHQQQQQQQQMILQQALFLRSVKQRTSPIDVLSSSPSFSGNSANFAALSSPSSSISSAARFMSMPQRQAINQGQLGFSFAPSLQQLPQQPVMPVKNTESLMLQELERRLLDDDDEEVEVVTASGTVSGVTNSEWGETMSQLMSVSASNNTTASNSPSPLTPTANGNNNNNNAVSLSPSNSSSSTPHSSASSSSPPASIPTRQLLVDAAAAIAENNMEAVNTTLATLKRIANPRGSAEQRLVSMMLSALAARLGQTQQAAHPLAELCGPEQRAATQLLHEKSPCFRLCWHAANLAILNAVADCKSIHLVDFDLHGGMQHGALIQALAERGVSSLKLTAVNDPSSPFAAAAASSTQTIAERLKKIADRVGLQFRFNSINLRAPEIEGSALGCDSGEALVVNLVFVLSRVPDESVSPANPRDELLRRVRALQPRLVVLAEQELNTNTAPFATRFADACLHYGALLESLEATVNREIPDRTRVEEALSCKAVNSVARDGPERVERCEVFGKWRARMGMAGLRPVPVGPGIVNSVKDWLASARPGNTGFTVKEENGGLGIGWISRVVAVTSTWR